MPDFLTRRNGVWHFVRVPKEYAGLDKRGIIRHSTKVRVAADRTGRRATRVADRLNSELEAYWCQIAGAEMDIAVAGYDAVRRRARFMGFDYVDKDDLISLPHLQRLERLEALVLRGLENDATARAAMLGTQAQPSFQLSKLFAEYETITKNEIKDLSPNQLRVWRTGRIIQVEKVVKWTAAL